MAETKYTPRPWYHRSPTGFVGTVAGSKLVASVYGDDANCHEDGRQIANAHLIAASPEMLEAATPFAKYGEILLGQKVRDDAVMVELFDCKITVGDFRKLASAISKAEGR